MSEIFPRFKNPQDTRTRTQNLQTLCVVCGERFQTVQRLQQHVREKHMLECVNDSPLTFDQFGWEETLIDLVRAKAHVIGTYIVQQS